MTSRRTLTFALSNFELWEGRQAHISVRGNVHVLCYTFHGKHFFTMISLETTPEKETRKDTLILAKQRGPNVYRKKKKKKKVLPLSKVINVSVRNIMN